MQGSFQNALPGHVTHYPLILNSFVLIYFFFSQSNVMMCILLFQLLIFFIIINFRCTQSSCHLDLPMPDSHWSFTLFKYYLSQRRFFQFFETRFFFSLSLSVIVISTTRSLALWAQSLCLFCSPLYLQHPAQWWIYTRLTFTCSRIDDNACLVTFAFLFPARKESISQNGVGDYWYMLGCWSLATGLSHYTPERRG